MAGSYYPRIVTDGLALCLDVGNRESYPGSGTLWRSAIDSESASLVNSPTYSASNLGYITFNGTNQYCTCTYRVSSRPFSFNVWIYFNSLTGFQTVLGQDSTTAGASCFWFQKITDGAPGGGRVSNTFGLAGIGADCFDPSTVSAGVWYNYCVSVDASSFITLYRNGNQVARNANSSAMNPPAAPPAAMVIGTGYLSDSLTDYSRVNMSALMIYNRELTAAEVSQNFNATRGRFGV